MEALHLHGDFETRSLAALDDCGLDVYADHWSTEVTDFGWAIGDDEVQLWRPGDPLPYEVVEHIYNGGLFYAHNAQFEFNIWNRVMVRLHKAPALRIEQMRCTMAMCYAMALPGKLEEAAPALGINERKDAEGHRVMMQMCKPRHIYEVGEKLKKRQKGAVSRYQHLPDGRIAEWWDNPEKHEKRGEYCKQDVRVERAIAKRLLPLSEREQKLWFIDQKINARGVRIDVAAVKGALTVVENEKRRLDAEMTKVTGGMVTACTQTNVLTDFVRFMGAETEGIAKADVALMLEDESLPAVVRKALELRQEAGKSSLAKLDKMLALLGAGDRIRFILAYHAATTGRWGGRGIQPQNFPRPAKWLKNWKTQDAILCKLAEGGDLTAYLDMMYGPAMDVLVNCLRGFLIAGVGCDFVADDFSNIEGRVLAWLAGEEWKLQAFREADAGTGPGIYELTYARSFAVDVSVVDEFMRQIGKVLELACGFGGGVGAFQAMAKVYNVKVKDKDAERFKELWRDSHPAIAGERNERGMREGGYWAALENAAKAAVLNPGTTFAAGPAGRQVKYRVAGSFLWCQLPSKRVLCYPYPKVEPVTTSWGATKDSLTFMTVPGDRPQDKARVLYDPNNRNRWARMSTYGGSLAENVTQAVARDLLSEAIIRIESLLDGSGYPLFDIDTYVRERTHPERQTDAVRAMSAKEYFKYLAAKRMQAERDARGIVHRCEFGTVMHAHDEIVVELPSEAPPDTLQFVEQEMGRLPAWAEGLPVESKGWRGRRYRKD